MTEAQGNECSKRFHQAVQAPLDRAPGCGVVEVSHPIGEESAVDLWSSFRTFLVYLPATFARATARVACLFEAEFVGTG